MRTVISIEGQTKRFAHTITHLTVDDGTEAEYYGTDIKIGDKVEVFFDHKWGKIKAQKGQP